MSNMLNANLYLVKEHVGMFKAANNYDIYDPQSGAIVMKCREEQLGFFTKLLRFTDYKRMTPFDIHIRTVNGDPVVRVKRGISMFLSKVDVFDKNNQVIGVFKQKFFSVGGAFNVYDFNDNLLFTLKGKWTGWNFKFLQGDRELAEVTKKWSGIGKELFTTADNYMLKISETVPPDSIERKLILAAVMSIDMVYKE